MILFRIAAKTLTGMKKAFSRDSLQNRDLNLPATQSTPLTVTTASTSLPASKDSRDSLKPSSGLEQRTTKPKSDTQANRKLVSGWKKCTTRKVDAEEEKEERARHTVLANDSFVASETIEPHTVRCKCCEKEVKLDPEGKERYCLVGWLDHRFDCRIPIGHSTIPSMPPGDKGSEPISRPAVNMSAAASTTQLEEDGDADTDEETGVSVVASKRDSSSVDDAKASTQIPSTLNVVAKSTCSASTSQAPDRSSENKRKLREGEKEGDSWMKHYRIPRIKRSTASERTTHIPKALESITNVDIVSSQSKELIGNDGSRENGDGAKKHIPTNGLYDPTSRKATEVCARDKQSEPTLKPRFSGRDTYNRRRKTSGKGRW